MLARFSLYGFLKNQRYFDPFLILVFREKGLSFLAIGVLVGFREICINLMEVPSGAVADLCGRRRCMVLSAASYIISFAVFAASDTLCHLFGAMFFFAVGDAFRTGTHKAMILDWLRSQGRDSERTRVYGLTRSWSQVGSAVSVIIATALVFYTGRFRDVFWFSIPPYLVNLLNLATYPGELDGNRKGRASLADLWRHLAATARLVLRRGPLRRLVAETMSFEGVYAAAKDYLQPVVKAAAVSLPVFLAMEDRQRTALVMGGVYALLYAMAGLASRYSHRAVASWGGEEAATRRMWWLSAMAYGAIWLFLGLQSRELVIAGFVLLGVLQNLWRPVQVSRYDSCSDSGIGATILSVDSQAKSLSTMIAAPLLGWAVDQAGRAGGAGGEFWPVAALGLAASLAMVAIRLKQDASAREGGGA